LKLSELRVVAFLHSSQRRVKTIVTLWILSTKNLFLVAQPGGCHFIAAFQGCFNCTKLLKRFFGNSLSEFCSHEYICSHFRLLLLSKFRILRSQKHQVFSLYRVSPLWMQEFKRDNQMWISS